MPEVTVPRTGLPPLKFRGEQLAAVSGSRQGGQDRNRWHTIALYRTDAGQYVLHVGYRTRWQGEMDHDHAAHAADPSVILGELNHYAPLAHVQGYPPGDAYREKQNRLEADIARRFEALISELYRELGEEFAETIA